MSIGAFREAVPLKLHGLVAAPSQVWGSVRLVPLIRARVREDLRVDRRVYDAVGVVKAAHNRTYISYIPHGLVFRWSTDGTPAAALGSWIGKPEGQVFGKGSPVRLLDRMVRREGDKALRLLPLHTAMEGFLSLGFAGPDVAWKEYGQKVLRFGFSPRVETAVPGAAIMDLSDALRIFEIHEDQCGVLLFVGDALASAMVLPHPADYRLLHRTMLQDFYGELLWQYGQLYREAPRWSVTLDDRVDSFAALGEALQAATSAWAAFDLSMAEGLLGRTLQAETVYTAGPFVLRRFLTGLVPGEENHLGELITAPDGELMVLRTYRLSEAQVKRGYLLSQLVEAEWNLEVLAKKLNCPVDELMRRVVNAGFGQIFVRPV